MNIEKRSRASIMKEKLEGRVLVPALLWLAGVPIFVIILLHLFGVFH